MSEEQQLVIRMATCLKDESQKKQNNSVIFCSCPYRGKVFIGHKTFLEIHSETVQSRHCLKQLQLMGICFKGAVCKNWPPIESILKTNRGQDITRVTTNCWCLLVSWISCAAGVWFWSTGEVLILSIVTSVDISWTWYLFTFCGTF